jgi:hypothetical protein
MERDKIVTHSIIEKKLLANSIFTVSIVLSAFSHNILSQLKYFFRSICDLSIFDFI